MESSKNLPNPTQRLARKMAARAVWLALVSWPFVSGCGPASIIEPLPQPEVVAAIRAGGPAPGASPGGDAVAAEVTGWATLTGTFRYGGSAPAPATIQATKDAQFCGRFTLVDESLLVGSGGGLANVVIYCRKVPEVNPELLASLEDRAVIDNKGCRFDPHVVPVVLSQTLDIKNSDTVGHNSNLVPPLESPFNSSIQPGSFVDYQFTRPQVEPVPVTCNVHPWMKGYVIPRPDPYIAVTASDGTFNIDKLPAGVPLEFQVWHERQQGKGLEARADWPGGRFTLTLNPDEIRDMGPIDVAPSALK